MQERERVRYLSNSISASASAENLADDDGDEGYDYEQIRVEEEDVRALVSESARHGRGGELFAIVNIPLSDTNYNF